MEPTGNNEVMKKQGTALPQKKIRDGVISICLAVILTSCAPAVSVQQTSGGNMKTIDTTVYPYPLSGQTGEQQDRDYYECSLWAVKQSGFDPELERLASEQRAEAVSTTPPGSDVVGGAAAGAIVGSIIAGPHSHGEGLILGMITGMFLGTASEQVKSNQVQQLQVQLNEQEWLRLEKSAEEYRRAMSACLEGRGYEAR